MPYNPVEHLLAIYLLNMTLASDFIYSLLFSLCRSNCSSRVSLEIVSPFVSASESHQLL